MASTATAQPADLFASAKGARVGVRSLWSKILSVICVALALLTLVPLFSIVFLVLKNGLPLLSWRVFTEASAGGRDGWRRFRQRGCGHVVDGWHRVSAGGAFWNSFGNLH